MFIFCVYLWAVVEYGSNDYLTIFVVAVLRGRSGSGLRTYWVMRVLGDVHPSAHHGVDSVHELRQSGNVTVSPMLPPLLW